MGQDARRVVIVGASAAGLRCAARLRRLKPGWQVLVLEQAPEFSVAACGMPYVLSGDIADREALRRTPDGTLRDVAYFEDVKGVHVLAGRRVTQIDVVGQTLQAVGPDGDEAYSWDELVLATGARARQLPGQPSHPRVVGFHTLTDLVELHGRLAKGQIERAVIVGAGLVGCELAEAFGALWGAEVTLLETAPQPLPQLLDGELGQVARRSLEREDVVVKCGVTVDRIRADDDSARAVVGDQEFAGDVVVVAIGVDPAVELAQQCGLRLGATGAIAVDTRLATSVAHVWAAGDCVESTHAVTAGPCYLPLGSLANQQGRTLANAMAGLDDKLPLVVGASAVKLFDTNVAAVGLTRSAALAHGIRTRSVWTTATDRADYWPEAKEILLQLVYEENTLRVLGLQAVGPGEVAKRVDAAAHYIAQGATLHELAHHEHAYAPPYAPALDPLAVVAMVALDQEDGVVAAAPGTGLQDTPLLDVRLDEERVARPVPATRAAQVTAMPHRELRGRLDELQGKSWLVLCERGTRSAEAVRLLRGTGVQATYLGGGLHWLAAASSDDAGAGE